MKKLTSYVNVFQGNGEINLPAPEGLAATWFFIKAQCGNTFPHAALPFSKMTVGAYSGAYPTGYGTHLGNYCGKVPKMYDRKMLCGLSHLHHSGTGAVGYYYNYALTAPFFGDICSAFDMKPLTDEKGCPGYYAATKNDKNGGIRCEATVTKSGTALHRYTFEKGGGKIAIDFGNNGLLCEKSMRNFSTFAKVACTGSDTAAASVTLEGVTLHFAVKCKGAVSVNLFEDGGCEDGGEKEYPNGHKGRFGVVFDLGKGKNAEILLSYSTKSSQKADSLCDGDKDACFDNTVKTADEIWEKYLGAIEIEADERYMEIFYSNLYHSIIKPANMCGESFIYDGDDSTPFFTDFTTLWDIYKTQLPLVFALYKDEARDISYSLMRICEALGHSPNCLTISDRFNTESSQARALTTLVLMSAHIFGVDGTDPERIFGAMISDIMNERNADYLKTGFCELYTHILDMADACHSASLLADELGRADEAEKLRELAAKFAGAYDSKTGLLSEKSNYYEGGLHNYSFRLCHDHEARVELAGGKQRYASLLEDFFGYGKAPVKQPTEDDKEFVSKGIALGRFEGFNNEPDMETPYSFIYADRHDRLCEVVASGMKYMFTTGEGGIPGNNDSGGLSACYIWNALGIFPEAGRDRMLIGSPSVSHAVLHTSGGKDFEISVEGDGIYVKRAILNGKVLENMYFKASDVVSGGKLVIELGTDNN